MYTRVHTRVCSLNCRRRILLIMRCEESVRAWRQIGCRLICAAVKPTKWHVLAIAVVLGALAARYPAVRTGLTAAGSTYAAIAALTTSGKIPIAQKKDTESYKPQTAGDQAEISERESGDHRVDSYGSKEFAYRVKVLGPRTTGRAGHRVASLPALAFATLVWRAAWRRYGRPREIARRRAD